MHCLLYDYRSANPNHISQNIRSLDISLHPSDVARMNELNEWMDELRDDDDDDDEDPEINVDIRKKENYLFILLCTR